MSILVDGSDAEFEALRDPCILVNGRRICPGADRDRGVVAGTDVDPDAATAAGGRPPAASSRTEGGVTFVPGVEGDDTTFTALEDLLRIALEEGQLEEAGSKANQLARLIDEAGGRPVQPRTLTCIGEALLATEQFGEARTYFRRALETELVRLQQDLSSRVSVSPSDALSMAMAPMLSGLARVAAGEGKPMDGRRLFQRALVMSGDPDNADILKSFAIFEWQQGRRLAAFDLMIRSLKLTRQFFGETTSSADTENKLGHLALEQDETLRVVRGRRRTPSRASSWRMVWLSADCDTPSFAAAFVKLRSRSRRSHWQIT